MGHRAAGKAGQEVNRQTRWQKKKQAQGLCARCGKQPLVNRWYCLVCREKMRAYLKERYQRQKGAA